MTIEACSVVWMALLEISSFLAHSGIYDSLRLLDEPVAVLLWNTTVKFLISSVQAVQLPCREWVNLLYHTSP